MTVRSCHYVLERKMSNCEYYKEIMKAHMKNFAIELAVVFCLSFIICSCSTDSGPKEWTPGHRDPVNPVTMDAQSVPMDEEVFPETVMAGDPKPDSMLLWTRSMLSVGIRLKVWIQLADDADSSKVDLIFDEQVTPDDKGFVHKRVNVAPGFRHEYAFFVEPTAGEIQSRSPIGSFVAAPPEGALVRLTFSGTHGTHQNEEPYPALIANASFEPFTLYIHLGDSIYSDSKRDDQKPACTLDEYLDYWDANWKTQGFRDVLKDTVYLPVPDDHEVANNYTAEFDDPTCPGRVESGKSAFFYANPVERDTGHPQRLWRKWRWGDTVEFFALDGRSERKPSTSDDFTADPPELNPNAIFMSPEQLQWLKDSIANSTAVFKLILNPVPITSFPNPPWLNQCDTWNCYNAQREDLISFLENGIDNVYFLSGDFHMAMVGHLDPPEGTGYELYEFFMGPGAQSNPLGDRDYIIDQLGEAYDPLPPDQFLWGYPTPTLTYVDLDPLTDPPTMTVRFYDPDGQKLFRAVFVGGRLQQSP